MRTSERVVLYFMVIVFACFGIWILDINITMKQFVGTCIIASLATRMMFQPILETIFIKRRYKYIHRRYYGEEHLDRDMHVKIFPYIIHNMFFGYKFRLSSLLNNKYFIFQRKGKDYITYLEKDMQSFKYSSIQSLKSFYCTCSDTDKMDVFYKKN